MKKCPRCEHEIKESDKFCPRCGLDLDKMQVKKNKPMSAFIHIIIFMSLLSIPFLYSMFLEGLTDNITNTNNGIIELGEYTKKDAIMVLGTFDTLTDFNGTYSNVSSYVESIQNYERTLSQNGYVFDKEYNILVLDNNNIAYQLTYTTTIDDVYEMTIIRRFDRAHTYNTQELVFKKSNQTSFSDLLLTDGEKDMILGYTYNDSQLNKVINDFSLREEEFNNKKEELGHFGIGSYDEKTSFVCKKYKDTYASVFKQYEDAQDYIH